MLAPNTRGPTFVRTPKRRYHRITCNLVSKGQRARLHGRDYIVARVRMIVPGVLPGSRGPLLYPEDEVSKDVGVWNGMPLTLYHPTRNGEPTTARDPDILEAQGIGFIFKTRFKGSLDSLAYFDEALVKNHDKRLADEHKVLPRLLQGVPIEVSTGLFTRDEPAEKDAVYNGKPYRAIARDYKPDHLAVLPDVVGACSVKDGCGVMVTHAFCPTGEGGGQDNSCGPSDTGTGSANQLTVERLNKNLWKVTAGANRYSVSRITKQRSRTREPEFGHVPGVRKPQTRTTTTWYRASIVTGQGEDITSTSLTPVGNVPPKTLKEALSLVRKHAGVTANADKGAKGDDENSAWKEAWKIARGTTHNAFCATGPGGGETTVSNSEVTPNEGDEMNKAQLVAWLVANCDCYKESKDALEKLDEKTLTKLKSKEETTKNQANLIANATKSFQDAEGNTYSFNAQTGLWEKTAKPPIAPPNQTQNSGMNTAPQNYNEWLQAMPADARPIWNSLVHVHNEKKRQLVAFIASFRPEPDREAFAQKLNAKEVSDLEDMASLLQSARPSGLEGIALPNYGGQAPALTGNTGGRDEIEVLEQPTWNYKEDEEQVLSFQDRQRKKA